MNKFTRINHVRVISGSATNLTLFRIHHSKCQ